MIDGVDGVGGAVGVGLIGDIDGAVPLFRSASIPAGCRSVGRVTGLYCADLSGPSHQERIVPLGEIFAAVSEASAVPLVLPSVSPGGGREAGAGRTPVMVYDGGSVGKIPFPRHHHVCSGVFKHRDDIRVDEAAREHILDGAEELGTLPYPSTGIIFAVAGPYGDSAPFEAVGRLFYGGERHERFGRLNGVG